MPTGDMVIGADGAVAIKIGRWAKDKLFYVKKFCDVFNLGMKNKWETRTYVDLFSGPGICVVEETGEEIPGSPVIALQCRLPFTHYFFNDLEVEFIKALESRITPCEFAKVNFNNKDCNLVVDDLLEELPDNSLDFCFVDPLNYEIGFNSIRKLSEHRNMDLLITFHVGIFRRIVDNPNSRMNDFFPYVDWQQRYREEMNRGGKFERVILDIYEEGLKDIGYKVVRDYIPEKNIRNVLLYYLVFASKHEMGAHFWDEVTKRTEAGQWRMQI
ncbi:MAG: three-Cys-motif partner protein TcmP [Dehalococcoidales bacterium]|nr:three-Cys-motif partner protein TcmP [Dehalococcoidales bacterium]